MIKRLLEEYKKRKEFNAENCRKYQQSELEKQASILIEDIKSVISFKVANTEEKAVIHSLSDVENDVFELVKDYFIERGFKVFKTRFQELGDFEFLVISWIL